MRQMFDRVLADFDARLVELDGERDQCPSPGQLASQDTGLQDGEQPEGGDITNIEKISPRAVDVLLEERPLVSELFGLLWRGVTRYYQAVYRKPEITVTMLQDRFISLP